MLVGLGVVPALVVDRLGPVERIWRSMPLHKGRMDLPIPNDPSGAPARGYRESVTTLEWITAGSVLVAALGIASAVFTQIWQSRQENKRVRDARDDRRRERVADEKLRLYGEFLTAAAAFERLCWALYMTKGDESAYARVARDSAGHERLPDLLSQVHLLAPGDVSRAAAEHDVALRWATQVYALTATGERADPPEPSSDWEQVRESIVAASEAGERTRAAMRTDLGLTD